VGGLGFGGRSSSFLLLAEWVVDPPLLILEYCPLPLESLVVLRNPVSTPWRDRALGCPMSSGAVPGLFGPNTFSTYVENDYIALGGKGVYHGRRDKTPLSRCSLKGKEILKSNLERLCPPGSQRLVGGRVSWEFEGGVRTPCFARLWGGFYVFRVQKANGGNSVLWMDWINGGGS